MPDPNVTMPRARFEAVARQCLALRDQVDALMALVQSELTTEPIDPREKAKNASVFNRRSA